MPFGNFTDSRFTGIPAAIDPRFNPTPVGATVAPDVLPTDIGVINIILKMGSYPKSVAGSYYSLADMSELTQPSFIENVRLLGV